MFFSFCIGLVFKLFSKKGNNEVSLFGHNLDGNLEVFYSHFDTINIQVKFMTISHRKYKKLKKKNINILFALYPNHYFSFLNSRFIISSHGLFFHNLINKFTNLRTYYCGHGFRTSHVKNTDSYNRSLQNFNEIWLYSDYEKEIYLNECSYKKNNIVVTGYPRNDLLKKNNEKNLKKLLNTNRIVLLALTEKNKNNNLMSVNRLSFLEELEQFTKNIDSKILINLHPQFKINKLSNNFIQDSGSLFLSDGLDEKSYSNLFVNTDILISDWSSIIVDYLIFKKPIYLLSNGQPKNYGYTSIMKEFESLRYDNLESIELEINSLNDKKSQSRVQDLFQEVFNDKYHENSLERCLQRL